jgi:prophage regulatory protein
MQTQEPGNNRLLRLRDVLALLPISRTSFYDGIKIGLYPQPIKLGKRTSAWRERDIHEFIDRMN